MMKNLIINALDAIIDDYTESLDGIDPEIIEEAMEYMRIYLIEKEMDDDRNTNIDLD